jgi:hypothetical protein
MAVFATNRADHLSPEVFCSIVHRDWSENKLHPPFYLDIKKMWIYTSIPPYALMV